MTKKQEPKTPAVIDEATGKVMTSHPFAQIKLHNLQAVRREISSVYRDMRRGHVDSQDGSRLVYVLGELRKIIEVIELEDRVKSLEELKK